MRVLAPPPSLCARTRRGRPDVDLLPEAPGLAHLLAPVRQHLLRVAGPMRQAFAGDHHVRREPRAAGRAGSFMAWSTHRVHVPCQGGKTWWGGWVEMRRAGIGVDIG